MGVQILLLVGFCIGLIFLGWWLRSRLDRDSMLPSADFLKNVIDTSSDLVFVKDTELRTILVNDAFAATIGKRPEDLYGKMDTENGWPPGIDGIESDDRRVLAGQEIFRPSNKVNINGKTRYFEVKKRPLRHETGKVIGVVGVAREISEGKQADEIQAIPSRVRKPDYQSGNRVH